MFGHLKAALRELSPDSNEKLVPGKLARVSIGDARDYPTLQMPYDREVPVIYASAGMRRIIALAYLLVWAWHEHLRASELLDRPPVKQIIFLIDEIEAHLHPRWQRTIVRALVAVVKALSSEVEVQLLTQPLTRRS